ncbi:MAG: lamin tail domain-containing protein [Saprospiraceae bacterium]|nr:lamin tail domain-containing protein [Saprospiraceae bacterium]
MRKKLLNILFIATMLLPIGLSAQISDLIFSEYGEGSSFNKYLELYNGTGKPLDLSQYSIWKITNDGFWFERDFPLSGFLLDGETYLIVHQDADSTLLSRRDTIGPPGVDFALFNGNEAYALVKFIDGDTTFIDVIGVESGTETPENWDVAGVDGAGAEHTWVRKPNICSPNTDWASSAGTNSDDSEWIVYDQNYWDDAGVHTTTCTAPQQDLTSELFFSEYGEGSESNKYLELYNGTGNDVDLSNYTIWKIINDGNWFEREFQLTGILANDSVYTIVNQDAGPELAAIRDTTGPISPEFALFNGNEAFALVKITGPDSTDRVILDVIGIESDTVVPENWDVAGVVGAGAEHTWVRKPTVCGPNADWASSAGTSADDSEWIVYDSNYWDNAGKHTFALAPAPQFAELPESSAASCGNIPDAAPSLLVTYYGKNGLPYTTEVQAQIGGAYSQCGGEIAYLWTYTDECGRTAATKQEIIVAPIPQAEFMNVPEDVTVDYENIPAPDSLFYTNGESDSCAISGSVMPVIVDNSSPCGGSLTYTWSFTDACDRTTTVSQKITINGEGGKASELFISEYGEGSGNNKYLELYNGTPSEIDLSNYTLWKITNEGNWFEAEFRLTGVLGSCQTYLIVNQDADETLSALADTTGPTTPNFALFNGNEAFALVKITGPDSTDRQILDVIGEESGDTVPDVWSVAGVEGAGAEHTWVRKSTICGPNADWASSAGTNAENSEWVVYDADYWDDAGKHNNECAGSSEYSDATELFFSEYGEGSNNNKYLELYNGTGSDVDLSEYTIWKIINDGNWFEREFEMEGILPNGETYMIVNQAADEFLASIRDTTGPVTPEFALFNGNEAFALVKKTGPNAEDRVILDVIGTESGDMVPELWDVAGVVGAGAEHTWIRKPTICGPNDNWPSSAGSSPESSEWIVYDQDYWDDAGKHTFLCQLMTADSVSITFQVDMSQATVSANGVHITGSFQNWDPAATPMSDSDGDGVYVYTATLPANMTYEYKFVNGNALGMEEAVPSACAQNSNRFVEVGNQDIVIDPVCYASCGICLGVFDVTFRVDMKAEAVSTNGVHLAGNFQGWDPAATEMTDPDGDLIYEVTLPLSGGNTYQYKFINGNAYGEDESVPEECAVDNNRVLEVDTADLVTDAFCFGSCLACDANSIYDVKLDNSLSVYPNPNNGIFTLQFSLSQSDQIRISTYNSLMQKMSNQVLSLAQGAHIIPMNLNQTQGLIFLKIETSKGIAVRQVIIQ